MMQDDDDDDDDDDNDDPMILNNRAKNHTSERTIVPWTVIFQIIKHARGSWATSDPEPTFSEVEPHVLTLEVKF